jgi:hypothetical protein
MSLLRDIQNAAIDANTPLAVVLRKCMVLAERLDNEAFKEWVNEELNGYAADAELPEYRRVRGIASIGNFAGPLGATMRAPLRLAPVPVHLRKRHEEVEFREGIAKLEEMARPEQGELISRWSGDLVAMVAAKYYEGYTLLEAHMEIPKNAVVGVLDSVRNKALKFALEIEREAPSAGEVSPGAKPVPDERVSQIFNTFIMGGAQNVAVGSTAVQYAQMIQAGNADALKRFLTQQGIGAVDIAELDEALAEDIAPEPNQPFGRRVSTWLGKMVAKSASGAWKVGTSAAADLLTAALKAYYGLP